MQCTTACPLTPEGDIKCVRRGKPRAATQSPNGASAAVMPAFIFCHALGCFVDVAADLALDPKPRPVGADALEGECPSVGVDADRVRADARSASEDKIDCHLSALHCVIGRPSKSSSSGSLQ